MPARRLLALLAVAAAGCQPPEGAVPPVQPPPAVPVKARPVIEWERATDADPPPKADAPAPPKAKPVDPTRVVVPEAAGPWPWAVGTARPPTAAPRTTVVPDVGTFCLTGVVVRPEAGRAVATVKLGNFAHSNESRVILLDTAAGRVLTEWKLPSPTGYHPIDLSPDGTRIVLSGSHRLETELLVWTIGADFGLKRSRLSPHTHPGEDADPTRWAAVAKEDGKDVHGIDHARRVVWAGFVGDALVTASALGQLRVFDAATLAVRFTLVGDPCCPAVTPDGTKLAVLAGGRVCLFDPHAGQILGTRPYPKFDSAPTLLFNPSGTTLAMIVPGRARLLSLADGGYADAILPDFKLFGGGGDVLPTAWLGDHHLFDGRELYDPSMPIAVWRYEKLEKVRTAGWETWAAVRRPTGLKEAEDKAVYLRPWVLPHPEVARVMAVERDRPGVFTLRSGDGVRIDVAGVPADRRAEARADLDKVLRKIGYRPDPAAVATLAASVDKTPGTQGANYWGAGGASFATYPARLRLTKDGKELWQAERYVPAPSVIRIPAQGGLAQALRDVGAGDPDYSLFQTAKVPPLVRGPNAPNWAFGQTEVEPARLHEWGTPSGRK